jgi:PIN domain nuclease of toxin-antitoxin system
MVNLDTHILIALLAGELTARERALMSRQKFAISDMVLWEIAKLVQLGRRQIDLESPDFRSSILELTVIPITLEIAQTSTRLDFSSDPADEIIAATSIVERIPLLTRDRKILKSRMVPFAG